MQRYKRNQVEEAIAAALSHADVEPASDLRIRAKRLLNADRTLSREPQASPRQQPYAFYTGEAPGRGSEVWFSDYEAFALLLALLLLQHGWPQGTTVRIMRQARPTLEPEHARILAQDPHELFDPKKVERQTAPGMLAVTTTDPVFLAIITTGRGERANPDAAPHALSVCRGQEALMRFMREQSQAGMSITSLELASSAQLLASHLRQTKPKARGRSSR